MRCLGRYHSQGSTSSKQWDYKSRSEYLQSSVQEATVGKSFSWFTWYITLPSNRTLLSRIFKSVRAVNELREGIVPVSWFCLSCRSFNAVISPILSGIVPVIWFSLALRISKFESMMISDGREEVSWFSRTSNSSNKVQKPIPFGIGPVSLFLRRFSFSVDDNKRMFSQTEWGESFIILYLFCQSDSPRLVSSESSGIEPVSSFS